MSHDAGEGLGPSEAEVEAARAEWVRRNGSRRLSDATIRALLSAAASASTAPAQGDAEALRREVERLRHDLNVEADAAEEQRIRFQRLLVAFHDATRRPLGVTPASGDEFYDWRLAEGAEERRPLVGTEEERRERPEVRLVAAQREKAAALGLLDGHASVVRQLEREKASAERARDEAVAELDRLRTLLADGPGPCVYCGLPAADLAKCPHGFPGCGRADDITPPDCLGQADVDRSGDDPLPDFVRGTTTETEDGHGW